MKIIETTYSMSVTKQVADYEPMNVHFSLKAEVEEDKWAEAYKEIRKKVRDVINGESQLLETYRSFSKRKPTISETRAYDEQEQEFLKSLK